MQKSPPDIGSLSIKPKGEGRNTESGTVDGPANAGWWNGLLDAVRRTPPNRDRYVDFLRLVAILAVVTGHWLMPAQRHKEQAKPVMRSCWGAACSTSKPPLPFWSVN